MARKRKNKAKSEGSAEPVANSATRENQRRGMAIGAALIVLSSLAIYGRTVGYSFTNWDDPMLILDNLEVRSLAPARVIDMFTPKPGLTYQPVRVLSYAIDYALWGGYNPVAFHAMNLLLHTLAGLLLALTVFAILGRLKPDAEFATLVHFRDVIWQELNRLHPDDGKSCLSCHGIKGKVPPFYLYPPDATGALSAPDLLANFAAMRNKVDRGKPESSPLLLKPLDVVIGDGDGHQGGKRYERDSPGFQVLRDWVMGRD